MDKVSIQGKGVEFIDFDSATFEIVVKKRDRTGKLAKEATKDVQNALIKCIQNLKEVCGPSFSPIIQTQLELKKATVWDQTIQDHIFKGYTAVFRMRLTVTDMANLGMIHNELTSVDGTEVDSPVFALSPTKQEEAERKAFEQAFAAVERKLADQKRVLKLTDHNFVIGSWETASDDRISSNFKGASVDSDELKVNAGKSKITVSLTVHYEIFDDR